MKENPTIHKDHTYIMQTYKRYPLVLTRGKGAFVWDDRGKKYLDFFSGISVTNLGHGNAGILHAIRRQTGRLIHSSNYYFSEPQTRLAEQLVKRSFPGRVFLSNSGAEANECAIKTSRKWAAAHPGPGGKPRRTIVSFDNSFHGRTYATLTATGQKRFHVGLDPLPGGFTHVPFNDSAAAMQAIGPGTAAVIVEPVLGEGGVVPADPGFLRMLRKQCTRSGALLIFDEIQTGLGRTGTLFAWQQTGVRPDILTLAKSLGGGLPLGATIIASRYAGALTYGDHGSTFGGNPVSCAAATALLDALTPAVFARVRTAGSRLRRGLEALRKSYPCIREVRGAGLMLGCVLDFPGAEIVEWCRKAGLLINCTQDRVLRFLPPLTAADSHIDHALHILEGAFAWKTSKK